MKIYCKVNLLKNTALKTLLSLIFAGLFSSCSTHQAFNLAYQEQLISQDCSDDFFNDEFEELKKEKDVIFKGLNAGYIARDCDKFKLSNDFLDLSEESYKYDVDLQSNSNKIFKFGASTLINDTIFDYEGFYYERTMLNLIKGLNFMSLKDFENARVEFNRALMRQQKAEEYFAYYIKRLREELEKKRNDDKNYEQNIERNSKRITKQYENLFNDFKSIEQFSNPYVSYVSAVFFFMDKDYRKAYDLLKEVFVLHGKDKEIRKQFGIFDTFASSLNPKKLKKYVFVIYENGLAPALDEVSFTLPFIYDDAFVRADVALPVLKKRASSFEYLNVLNSSENLQTRNLFDFDSIVASEFKANLNLIIAKALLTTTLKTTLNVAVSKNDSTGILSLISGLFTMLSTKVDVRFWNFLPKNMQVVMLENEGFVEILNPNQGLIFSSNLNPNKDVLILVRSFAKEIKPRIYLIEN